MTDDIELIATQWKQVIVVCRKCSKKMHGGFGPDGKHGLPDVLKAELRRTGRRRTVRIVESKCLGLCPKKAVAIIPAQDPGAMLRVPMGTDPAAVLAKLPPA